MTTVLTVHADGRWELDPFKGNPAKLFDVTHLPCRSARYTPASGATCTPAQANKGDFPVSPGAKMPSVNGCNGVDYAVLFVIAEQAS